MYSLTCFGRPHAHHQELSNCSSSLWFYRWSVVVAVLLFVEGSVNIDESQYRLIPKTRLCLDCPYILEYVASSWLIYFKTYNILLLSKPTLCQLEMLFSISHRQVLYSSHNIKHFVSIWKIGFLFCKI
jgi:hypothetical protein